jgi:hypothetical protein
LYEDWDLIEASFAKQYGIRLETMCGENDMSWPEFSRLLNGIMPNTPLGSIVQIRAEEDPDVLEHFTREQRSIRDKWRTEHSPVKEMSEEEKEASTREAQQLFAQIFG